MPHELRGFPSRPFGSAVTRVLGGGGDDDLRGEALGDLEPGYVLVPGLSLQKNM